MAALLTQRNLAQQIADEGGDYVMIVKGNQPQLQEDSATVFALEPTVEEQRDKAQTIEVGHGRIGQRQLIRTYAKTFAIAENKWLTAKGKTCKSLNSAILRKSY